MDAATEMGSRRRIDTISTLMVVLTAAGLLGAAWLRFGPSPTPGPPIVGGLAPPVQVLDLDTSETMVLAGLGGKVVWLVFWSARSESGPASLPVLDNVWNRLKAHKRFLLVAAAVETDQSDRVRDLTSERRLTLPVYLCSPETRRRYGVEHADPPLHVLIDAAGHIIAIARGAGRPTIERIADQAKRQLDELDPLGDTRFASAEPPIRFQTTGRVVLNYSFPRSAWECSPRRSASLAWDRGVAHRVDAERRRRRSHAGRSHAEP